MSNLSRDPVGYHRPSIALIFAQPAPRDWLGMKASDRCAELTPLGRRLLRAHLQAQTEPSLPIESET